MSALPWIVATGGTLLAAISAMADGALLADRVAAGGGERTGVVPVAPGDAVAAHARERTHRALASSRIIGLGVAGAAVAIGLGAEDRPAPQALALLVVVGLAIVTIAESVARAVGDAWSRGGVERLRPFMRSVELVATPILRLGEQIEQAINVLAPPPEASTDLREQAAAQFRDVVTAETDVSREERNLLLGVFSFGETTAEEVMVPRVDIVGIERKTPWSEVVDRVRSARHSRIPVYDDTIDEIIGILYAKDLLASVVADVEPAGGWLSLIRAAVFVPASKRIADLLREFRATRRHIAIVADEYGGTAGLVTIEDVLEELVGEIRDEYDDEERHIESEAGSRFWVSGRLTLDDLSEAIGADLRRDDVSTIGGLVLELLGRVPRAGEELTLGGFRLVVERVVRRKVERVYLERIDADGSEPAGAE
jgi:CBS domain containing-hemolysin-like protein